MVIVPVDGSIAGSHLPLFGGLARVQPRAKRRLEELVGEEDAAFAQVTNEATDLPVVLEAGLLNRVDHRLQEQEPRDLLELEDVEVVLGHVHHRNQVVSGILGQQRPFDRRVQRGTGRSRDTSLKLSKSNLVHEHR